LDFISQNTEQYLESYMFVLQRYGCREGSKAAKPFINADFCGFHFSLDAMFS